MTDKIYYEEYLVRYKEKQGEFWINRLEELVYVPLLPGAPEKCNHERAKMIFQIDHPNAVVLKVFYC